MPRKTTFSGIDLVDPRYVEAYNDFTDAVHKAAHEFLDEWGPFAITVNLTSAYLAHIDDDPELVGAPYVLAGGIHVEEPGVSAARSADLVAHINTLGAKFVQEYMKDELVLLHSESRDIEDGVPEGWVEEKGDTDEAN